MNLHKSILTKNACYKAAGKLVPKGIMVHSTGANNPNLRRYVPDDGLLGVNTAGNHWNTYKPGGISVCVHAFIGKMADGSIATYQTLPWTMRGWHAGGRANDTHIGFEICEDDLTDKAYFNAVYKEAVELCAYLCGLFGLTEKNIICHSEGYKLGIASGHADVMHWFPKHGKNMDMFRADVKKLLEGDEPMTSEERAKFNQLVTEVAELRDIVDKSRPMVYNYIDKNMPEYMRPYVKKAVDMGIVKGDGHGLNLTDDKIWSLITNMRMNGIMK